MREHKRVKQLVYSDFYKVAKVYEQAKLTLKTTSVTSKERKLLTAIEIRAIREKYNMSRALFANFLHISPRTLENGN